MRVMAKGDPKGGAFRLPGQASEASRGCVPTPFENHLSGFGPGTVVPIAERMSVQQQVEVRDRFVTKTGAGC